MLLYRLPIAGLLLALVLLSCASDESRGTSEDTSSSSADTSVEAYKAIKLSDKDWIDRGIPDPNRVWQGGDMLKAVQVLQQARASGNIELPRMSGAGSRIFDRMTSRENLAVFQNTSLPPEERMAQGATLMTPFTQIYLLYIQAAMNGEVYSDEVIESIITLLYIESEFTELVDSYVATIPETQRETPDFQAGMKQIRDGIAQSLNGTITILRDKGSFYPAQLERLADSLEIYTPVLLENVGEEHYNQLQEEAATTIKQTKNEAIIETLQKIFPELKK